MPEETVDGAKIAANIIAKMKGPSRDRIVKAIQAKNPGIAARINQKMWDFNSILDLTSQSAQLLIKEIDHKDLVISLKTAQEDVREILLGNMSERKRIMVEDDLSSLPPTRISDVEDAQKRILTKLEDLRNRGLIRTKADSDIWV